MALGESLACTKKSLLEFLEPLFESCFTGNRASKSGAMKSLLRKIFSPQGRGGGSFLAPEPPSNWPIGPSAILQNLRGRAEKKGKKLCNLVAAEVGKYLVCH
ncbi:hypothetical protein TNIN_114691 [Trichonephila inaurata madagascariensis]|uniref:Uncharacterized protein n=1 Tax=Trichonephila inaurata madagascariensis TaxID=2747483 RepID=A0A8X7C121_9ARAC|nr:hypothetical protein TNIN_114691 [Trichonephila inaurata madagascariensis]